MKSLLSIQELTVDFKTDAGIVSAVQNISLEINRGEIVAVVGESGSGKSVTALSILQLLPTPPARYTSGKILFSQDGESSTDLLHLSINEMRKVRGKQISIIFQEPMTSLNPVFTCGDQVMESIMLHEQCKREEAKQKTIALFDKVKLPSPASVFRRYPHQLSGGQKQRVMIAMAMSCNPALLICDEPTTALDVTVQKTILRLIKELQQQTRMGVLFITHDLGLVKEIADRCVVMLKGEIVESGTISQIFSNPQHAYTKGLLACRPILHVKGERLPTVSDFMNEFSSKKINDDSHSFEETAEEVNVPQSLKSSPLIQVQHLAVWFPRGNNIFGKPDSFVKAVDGVSFDVYEGETLGLVGESGCGKTTLGRALLQLVRPKSGSVLFRDTDLVTMPAEQLRKLRRDMQIIFQDPYSSLNPRITIGDALREPLKIHSVLHSKSKRNERVVELLEKVDLSSDMLSRYPHEFSGGQRQRIVIARALALNPGFIICDESVSALDVSVQAQVLNLLNDLKKEFGFTVIFISHDLSVVHYLSDRIMVMNKGRIEEIGEAAQVFNHPASEYTKKLINAIPGL